MREAIRGDVSAIKSHQERNQEPSGAQSRAIRSAIKSTQDELEQRHGLHGAHRRQCGRVLAARRRLDKLLIDLMRESISAHQRSSAPISGNQWQSVLISAHQCSSVLISAH
jgi:hypothetical protein